MTGQTPQQLLPAPATTCTPTSLRWHHIAASHVTRQQGDLHLHCYFNIHRPLQYSSCLQHDAIPTTNITCIYTSLPIVAVNCFFCFCFQNTHTADNDNNDDNDDNTNDKSNKARNNNEHENYHSSNFTTDIDKPTTTSNTGHPTLTLQFRVHPLWSWQQILLLIMMQRIILIYHLPTQNVTESAKARERNTRTTRDREREWDGTSAREREREVH